MRWGILSISLMFLGAAIFATFTVDYDTVSNLIDAAFNTAEPMKVLSTDEIFTLKTDAIRKHAVFHHNLAYCYQFCRVSTFVYFDVARDEYFDVLWGRKENECKELCQDVFKQRFTKDPEVHLL